MIVYNSHGIWSTLKHIKEIETERGNYFPSLSYPDDTPCIWICIYKNDVFRYHCDDPEQIEVDEKSVLCAYDGDGGFLLLQPKQDK